MKAEVETSPELDVQAQAARVEQVTTLFTGLVQALRALQLYGSANLGTQRAIDSVRAGFEQLWTQGAELEVDVCPDSIVLGKSAVYQNPSNTDSIAFLMFRDGIRTLSFREGFEGDELQRFLAVLHRARYQPTESDDLVTLLWDEDFLHLRHGYIDADATAEETEETESAVKAAASASRALALQIHDASTRALESAIVAEQSPAGSDDPPALAGSAINLQARSLHLDPEALVYLQRELEEEMRRDLEQDVINALLDSIEEPDTKAQSEILQIFAVLIPQLLGKRHLRLVTNILNELRSLPEQPGVVDDRIRRQLDELFANLAGTSALEEFLAAMEAGDVQSDLDCIENFASHFGFVLLPRLLRIREKAVGKELRATLETTTERLAREHPEAVREGLHDDDPLVVRGALRILVGLGAAEAIPETMRLLDHGDTRVRLGAVEVLVALGAEPGLEALVHALDDEVREVRVAALWGLATWQHSPALSQLVQRIDAKAFRYTESDEKMAILDAYARIGGEAAVEHLGKLLNARSMFKAKEPTDVRACAARALGSVGSPEAKAMLSRAQGDRDPEVRRAVQRSLRKVGSA